jgi:hypothetical protein
MIGTTGSINNENASGGCGKVLCGDKGIVFGGRKFAACLGFLRSDAASLPDYRSERVFVVDSICTSRALTICDP